MDLGFESKMSSCSIIDQHVLKDDDQLKITITAQLIEPTPENDFTIKATCSTSNETTDRQKFKSRKNRRETPKKLCKCSGRPCEWSTVVGGPLNSTNCSRTREGRPELASSGRNPSAAIWRAWGESAIPTRRTGEGRRSEWVPCGRRSWVRVRWRTGSACPAACCSSRNRFPTWSNRWKNSVSRPSPASTPRSVLSADRQKRASSWPLPRRNTSRFLFPDRRKARFPHSNEAPETAFRSPISGPEMFCSNLDRLQKGERIPRRSLRRSPQFLCEQVSIFPRKHIPSSCCSAKDATPW